ncbi:MAG: DUF1080 domain-containing protein [Marinilabiliales bacterium]|nr:DUF1080 domain-containing protein [Marinilabiliales bacterium]
MALHFDGKTSAGWRGYNKAAFRGSVGWEVVDGTLHCKGSGAGEAGGGGGDIIYDKKLESTLSFLMEWKISEGRQQRHFHSCDRRYPTNQCINPLLRMQVLDNEKHPDARLGVNGNRMAGSL